jgi:mono/diheme cytochrome c family protein/uncharacterized membrane protein SirB2
MPVTAFLHTHVLVVVLFLILFLVKAFLLFTNKHEALEKMKKKTKVLDMIFGTLILVTGGYLLTQYHGVPTWLIVKIVLVLVAIPLAIVGIKKHNKVLTALSLVVFLYVYGVAETKSLNMKKGSPATVTETTETTTTTETTVTEENGMAPVNETVTAITSEIGETALANAKQIYNSQCETCHGGDGKKGLNNATDLTTSKLTRAQRKEVILNGRGLMPAFQGKITEQEAEEVAAFTEMLAK